MNPPRYTPLEPPTTVTPSLTLMQQAFTRVQQRFGPSTQAQSALSTVQEQSETSSVMSRDRMSDDTIVPGHGRDNQYEQVDGDDYDDSNDPFSDARSAATSSSTPGPRGSRVLRYANEVLDTVSLSSSRPMSAVSIDPIPRPESAWSSASSSVATHSTGSTYLAAMPRPPNPPAATRALTTTNTIYPTNTNLITNTTGTPMRVVDHFRQDTEALSTSPYRNAPSLQRSRSPTPAPDDEDYHIDEAGSSQYTGYTGTTAYTSDTGYTGYGYTSANKYDEEKAQLPASQGLPTLSYTSALAWRTSQKLPISDAASEKTASTFTSGYTDDSESTYTNSRISAVGSGAAYTDPQSPMTTRHFGPAPTGRVQRRLGDKRRVPLVNGHLTVDLDVPDRLKTVLPMSSAGKDTEETTKLRYTAVMGDPDGFPESYWLRQNQYQRTTELFIVITMYNEDEVLLCRTLYGVMRNISHLCTRKNSRTWGPDAWKKVVVCIVADGRKKVHPRVLDVLTLLGVYQPGGHMKSTLNGRPISAHLFEYTATFGLDQDMHFRYPDKGVVPTQIIFLMKEKNQKKINSHRWFFNAFGPCLQPNVCVLLDVGTMPGPKSIYHLWKTFDLNSNVGGACGEIAAYKGKRWSSLINPLVAAQNFEYKVANILDKPMESLFGFISVLPGAFSAYRYIALQNDEKGIGPLASYFKGEVLHGRDTDIFTSNMYLAEDRILCFELVAKADSSWLLRYVKSAIGETDVPDALPEFISQRRRWLNGSFFAATYAIAHAETVYNVINLIASWFALGNFYLFFVILTSSLETEFHFKIIRYLNAGIQYLMAGLIIAAFLLSMGNKPKASRWKYKGLTILFAILMCHMIFCAAMAALQASRLGGGAYNIMVFSLLATYGVYLFSSFLAFDPWHMFTSFLPYMLLSPTYINILNVYAFCNLDDISWGTKQDTVVETDLGALIQNSNSQVDVEVHADSGNDIYDEALQSLRNRNIVPKVAAVTPTPAEKEQMAMDYYASVRTNVLLSWVLSNGVLLAAILGGGDPTTTFSQNDTLSRTKAYMTFILAFVGITSIVRFTGSTMYLIARIFTG